MWIGFVNPARMFAMRAGETAQWEAIWLSIDFWNFHVFSVISEAFFGNKKWSLLMHKKPDIQYSKLNWRAAVQKSLLSGDDF